MWLNLGAGRMQFSRSTDQGATWSAVQNVSAAGEGDTRMCHIAVGADGAVYMTYHSQPTFSGPNPDGTTGLVFLLRADDGGANLTMATKTQPFTAGNADITYNFQWDPNIPSNLDGGMGGLSTRRLDRSQSMTFGFVQAWILPDPTNAQNVSVLVADDPTNSTHGAAVDDMSLYITRSTNRGQTQASWSTPVQVDDGAGVTMQLMPTAAMALNSQCLTVAYYENRNGGTNAAGFWTLDLLTRTSSDGGQTWSSPAVRVSDAAFNPDFNAFPYDGSPIPTLRIGEYLGVVQAGGVVWTSNNPLNGLQQTMFDFSDGTPPVVTAPPKSVNTCRPSEGSLGPISRTDVCGLGTPSNPTSDLTTKLPLAIGPNTVKWSSTDGAGNIGTADQSVTVADSTQPEFTFVPPNQPAQNCGPANIGTATATDDCAGSITPVPMGSMNFQPGPNTITWVATDPSGNQNTADTVVTVTAPSFTLNSGTYNGSQWWGTITFTNTGTSPSNNFKVEFDVPSGKWCTAEPSAVPPGATLTPLVGSNPQHTPTNHCTFTWFNYSDPIMPTESFTFNYSANTQQNTAPASITITDTVCSCTPETEAQFCARLAKNCGSVTGIGNCGVSRTVNCGSCMAPATCGGAGVANVCGNTLDPTADAYVRDGSSANTNFGSDVTLVVKDQDNNTGNTRRSFLKFDLTGITGPVTKAKLRLFGNHTEDTTQDAAYSVSDNSWTEGGITWNNKPPVGTKQDGNVTITTTAKYYEFDVTAFVNSQLSGSINTVSLAVLPVTLTNNSPDTFNSREAATNRPQLKLEK
jgi:hypothetical protein